MGFSVVRSFLEEKASPAIRTESHDAGAGFEFQNILPDLTAPPMWQIGYAREELVAELGAAFLCADLEITPEVQEDHASYIVTWLQVLENDHRAIFQAAAHAQHAVDYLHSFQPKQTEAAA